MHKSLHRISSSRIILAEMKSRFQMRYWHLFSLLFFLYHSSEWSYFPNAITNFIALIYSSVYFPSFAFCPIFSIAYFFIPLPRHDIPHMKNGMMPIIIRAKTGPMAKASANPENIAPNDCKSYESFSPDPSCMWKKFSDIFEGRASIYYFSKKAVSCFIKAFKYNDLRLTVIFSACYCIIV